MSRDRFYPTGARRWWAGGLVSGTAMEVARRFDGTNEKDVGNWFRASYGTWLTPETGNFLLGVLSESENKTIAEGLNEVIMDHFVDVVDRNGATDLVFRSGATKTIQPGSWIVNCTGYLMRADHPYEPYVSGSGAVVSIQPRSATLHLSSFIAYFLTHLLFLGEIGDVALYELDVEDLRRKSNAALPYNALYRWPSTTSASSPTASRPRCFSTADSTLIAGTRCHAACSVRHGSCSRTAANASISAAPWTPCANGSMFVAAR